MSENEYIEYIELNEFEDALLHYDFDSLGNDGLESEVNVLRRGRKVTSARHRIEEYQEMKNLREQLYDPVFNLDKSFLLSGNTDYT